MTQAIEYVDGREHVVVRRHLDPVALALEASHRAGDLVGGHHRSTAAIVPRGRLLQSTLRFGNGLPHIARLVAAGQCGVEAEVGGQHRTVSGTARTRRASTPAAAQDSAADAGH